MNLHPGSRALTGLRQDGGDALQADPTLQHLMACWIPRTLAWGIQSVSTWRGVMLEEEDPSVVTGGLNAVSNAAWA